MEILIFKETFLKVIANKIKEQIVYVNFNFGFGSLRNSNEALNIYHVSKYNLKINNLTRYYNTFQHIFVLHLTMWFPLLNIWKIWLSAPLTSRYIRCQQITGVSPAFKRRWFKRMHFTFYDIWCTTDVFMSRSYNTNRSSSIRIEDY